MANFWENDPVVGAPATASGAPKPIFTVPDPLGAEERAREARGEGRDVAAEERAAAAAARAAREEVRSVDDASFDRASTLRTEFLGLDDVKKFREVNNIARQIGSLAEREGSAMGDIGLVFSFMKALDPGSTVMAGEQATAQNAANVPDRLRNAYNSLVSGENLTTEQRQDMAAIARSNVQARAIGYNDLAQTYRGLLQAEGADPDAQGITLYEIQQEANEPTQADQFANGAQMAADKWGGPDGSFDRNAYLADQYELDEGQEAKIVGFWNAQRGNANLSVDAARAWYAGQGLSPPSDEDLAQAISDAQRGEPFARIDTSAAQAEYQAGLDAALAQRGADPESFSGAVGINAAQGLTFQLGDQIAGLAGGANALMQGKNPVAGYQVERDLILREQERAREARPITSAVSELAGGVATGALVPGRLVNSARGAAKVAMGEGAIYGYGSGEGLGDSLLQTGVGAGTGAALGYGVGKLAERVAGRPAPVARSPGREVIDAADRTNVRTGANIQPLPADVGGATVRRATGGTTQSTFGAEPIAKASERMVEETQGAVETLAGREGRALTPQGAGEQAIKGAEKTLKTLKTRVDANYAKARRLSGDTRVPLTTAIAAVDQHIAELADTPGGAAKHLKRLRDLRAGMEGNWTPEGIRRMRTDLRDDFASDGLRGSDIERRAMDVVDAAELDIEQGLSLAGKADAARAWKDASASASERFTLIDDVIEPILGRKGDRSGEGAFKALDRLSTGDAVALGKFMKALPAEEAGNVRATVIARLGKATKGQQDADGQSFSLARFLTNYNDEGMSPEAKAALFGGELRTALDDIARIAQGTKEAQGFSNRSNTGGANFLNAMLNGGPALVGFLDIPTAVATTLGSVVAQNLTGRALASPALARWLARAGKVTTPAGAQAHARGLAKIARAEPAIATQALGLQNALLNALKPATKVAAQSDQDQTEASAQSPGAAQ